MRLAAKVRAKGPLINAVAEPPLMVPTAVAVPKVRRFVAVVLTKPEVRVKVPLTEIGLFRVTPVALLLLMVRLEKLAVGDAAKFLMVPVLVIC